MSGTQEGKGAVAGRVLAMVVLIWAGMVIGVSGLATPVKFQAELLTLPVALDVGQVTFRLFSRVEWGLALVVLMLLALGRAGFLRLVPALIALVIAVVLMQAVWVIPALEERVEAVIAGTPLPDSPIHMVYVAAEAVKIVALVACGWLALPRR